LGLRVQGFGHSVEVAFLLETVARIDTLGELDDKIIAPLFGFSTLNPKS
jgi:predicted alpha/beta-fold hydrolase